MKQFKGVKQLTDIIVDAENGDWEVDVDRYREGSDWIYIRDMHVRLKQIAVNVFNGHFYVYAPISDDPIASHVDDKYDDEKWYKEILNLVYDSEK